jgi:hypothetical protein
MTPQHFNEIFYTVLMSTHSNKSRISRAINISTVTINNYLTDGVPVSKQFMILDRLEKYLFDNLGGKKNDKIRERQSI